VTAVSYTGKGLIAWYLPYGNYGPTSLPERFVDSLLETARYMLYHGAYQRSQGRSAIMEAALAKLHISECWVKCCAEAIQIHGGYGYMTECEVERELRDAIASRLFSGASEIQRNIIASLLL
jgi:alkylation response protein AidB-like acyl-CoA dehydrogenase